MTGTQVDKFNNRYGLGGNWKVLSAESELQRASKRGSGVIAAANRLHSARRVSEDDAKPEATKEAE